MAFLACILTVVSCICQPLMNAMRSSMETEAQGCFSFLTNWIVGQFNSLISSRRSAVEEVPASSASIVGAEETLPEIRNHLSNDSVGIIGIWGMGGIGKTALLQKINNDFFESGARGMFDLVIWVTVSKQVNISEIQKKIGTRLGLSFSEDESRVEENASILFKALSQKRFLVLLDDLWKMIDLATIGIPKPRSRRSCKIAFTTRSLDVCNDMDADKTVRVKVLDETQSWELFCSKLRTEVVLNNPRVQGLAKQVVHKCGGLPLALITIGKAMANRRLPNEWEHAVKALDHSAEKLRGMDEVLSSLKFSYDYLENDKMKSALLYCAMYPEDENISREELIEHWVGEGLLDGDVGDVDDGIDGARNRGHVLISNLQDSCLLEAGIEDAEQTVRMHDAVRDMALWLSRMEYNKVDGFLVLDGENLTQLVTPIQRREHVRRIWVCNLHRNPPRSCINIPDYPNTWTLLVYRSTLEPSLLQPLFNFMRTLRVLDLSDNWVLPELPIEIGLLVGLRYLNLSHTLIESLPKELGNLVELTQLLLESTKGLRKIPREAMAGLSNLQVLKMTDCGYDWGTHGKTAAMEQVTRVGENQEHSALDADAAGSGRLIDLSDLEGLRRLQELHIELHSSHTLERILVSDVLCKRTRRLQVWNSSDSVDPLYGVGGTLLRMTFNRIGGHLRALDLSDDENHHWVGELRISLDELPCLERLTLSGFQNEMTIVLVGTNPECSSSSSSSSSGGGVAPSVQSLRWLCIDSSDGLTELKFVGRFLCLESIELVACSGIEKLVLTEDDGLGTGPGLLDSSYFPMLKIMSFNSIHSLESIGRRPLLLPSLETILVYCCPKLTCLPLARGSAPKLKKIKGSQDWWDALDGPTNDGRDIKSIFAPFFESPYA